MAIRNLNDRVDLNSGLTDPLALVIDTKRPLITSEPVVQAAEGQLYAYDIESDEEPNGHITYTLIDGPAGMTIQDAAIQSLAGAPFSSVPSSSSEATPSDPPQQEAALVRLKAEELARRS